VLFGKQSLHLNANCKGILLNKKAAPSKFSANHSIGNNLLFEATIFRLINKRIIKEFYFDVFNYV
jgi:hypothetical protein